MTDSLKVLIVDDDPMFLEYQKDILTEVGLQVETTQDPKEVIHLIKEYDPDLLILDKVMEIDGLVIAEQVKKAFDYLPVLIITATERLSDKKKAFTLGCIDYLRKDIDNSEFMRRIEGYCHVGHIAKSLTEASNTLGKLIDQAETKGQKSNG